MVCPRCDSDNFRVMAKSPVGDKWEMYVCDNCKFSWRSIEDVRLFPVFRMETPEKVAAVPVLIPVPPLNR